MRAELRDIFNERFEGKEVTPELVDDVTDAFLSYCAQFDWPEHLAGAEFSELWERKTRSKQ